MDLDNYKQLVWDYNLTKSEFEEILKGKKVVGNFDQNWAIVRVLENLNYYDAMKLVPIGTLRKNWKDVQNKLFKSSIRNGYEFVLQRYPVPVAG